MRDVNEFTITDAVIARLGNVKDPRVAEISHALVHHLHAFVREIEPTQDEWFAAIDFLTRVGQMCDDTRQEFILLSDTLGVSMLVDAINNRNAGPSTDTTILGPFYVHNPPAFENGANISPFVEGEALYVAGSVASTDGRALAGATVDVWHSDGDGFYDVQQDGEVAMRARLHTGHDGRFHFKTVMPAPYPIPTDGPVGAMLEAQGRHPFRPAHIHFMIAAPGHRTLITHLFVAGDEYLDTDAVFGVKSSLICEFPTTDSASGAGSDTAEPEGRTLNYDFVLAAAGADHL